MLVLSRKVGQEIDIFVDGKKIRLVFLKSRGDQSRIGIEADKEVKVIRSELKLKGENEHVN
jgi:carbon storage regulator CsrA